VNLRTLARDKPCYVRLPDVCNGNPETSVLAHLRLIGISGMGMKAPDILACPACSCCHDAIDRRSHMDLDRDYVRLAHMEGVARWQSKLIQDGVLALVNAKLERV
jgi:hypothetical protein